MLMRLLLRMVGIGAVMVTLLLSGCGSDKDNDPQSETEPPLLGASPINVRWVVVDGAAQQADPNTGYIAFNAVESAVITLPVEAEVGDIVAVTGSADGGWRIAQNPDQTIVADGIFEYGTVWFQSFAGPCFDVASSADGTRLVAARLQGQIQLSRDAGATWIARGPEKLWYSVASSADGSKLVAVARGDYIYTSADYGETWTQRGPSRKWESVTSSADGTKLAAVAENDYIYVSTDSGVTWTQRGLNKPWRAVASSADGTRLIALGDYTSYRSTDSGATWDYMLFNVQGKPTYSYYLQYWQSVACSADGKRWIAGSSWDDLYLSSDYGYTWYKAGVSGYWSGVASSADGRVLLAAPYDDLLYVSTDYGQNWQRRGAKKAWYSVATAADGSSSAAVDFGGPVFVSHDLSTSLTGTAGFLYGENRGNDAVLQYAGNGQYDLISYRGRVLFDRQIK